MNGLAIKLIELISAIVRGIELFLHTFFFTISKSDVEKKISKLHKDRMEIIARYEVMIRIRNLSAHGLSSEVEDMIKNKELSINELHALKDNFDIVEYFLAEEKIKSDNNKNATIANLYLLSEKKKYFNAKVTSVIILVLSAIAISFFSIPPVSITIGLALYTIYEIKDQIISYRVLKGYFGTATFEAIELIKFIRKNIDSLDSGGNGGGLKQKILNPISDSTSNQERSDEVLPNA